MCRSCTRNYYAWSYNFHLIMALDFKLFSTTPDASKPWLISRTIRGVSVFLIHIHSFTFCPICRQFIICRKIGGWLLLRKSWTSRKARNNTSKLGWPKITSLTISLPSYIIVPWYRTFWLVLKSRRVNLLYVGGWRNLFYGLVRNVGTRKQGRLNSAKIILPLPFQLTRP